MAIEDAVILEKDLARMKPKDVVAELKKQGLPLLTEDLPLLQTKLAVPSKGLELSIDRPVLVHRAIEVGVMTDGFLLVENKEAVEQVVGKFLENEKRKEVRKLIRLKSFPTEAEARVHIDALFDQYSKEGTFPDHKALYPEEVGKELKLIGVYAGTEDEPLKAGSADVYAYLSEGSIIIPVDANKLAFVLKHLPDAKMFPAMRQGKVSNTSPVVFQVRGEEKGLLMPLQLQGFPDAIEAKALKATPKIDPSEEKGVAPPISAKVAPAKPEKAKPTPSLSYSRFIKAYDSKEEAHEAALDGFRNIEEAKEHAQGMRSDDVIFTAKGIPMTKKALLHIIAKEAKPPAMEKAKAEAQYKELMKPRLEAHDREIQAVNDDFMAGKMSSKEMDEKHKAIHKKTDAVAATMRKRILKDYPKLKLEAKAMKAVRLTVRPKTYRGEAGFTVRGEATSIFFNKESQAREYVRRIKAGERSQDILSDIWHIKQVRSGYTIAELIRIHTKRTPLSRASDERQSHQVTIGADDLKAKAWIKDPGTADIEGIDTPPISKRGLKISRKTPRITPKAGRLE